jgi:hypothetical protein
MTAKFTVALLSLVSLMLASCAGPGFNSVYRKSVDEYHAANPKPTVSGPWVGYWKSNENLHTGKLRAIAVANTPAVPADGAAGRYKFRYHATWAKILSGGYTSVHDVVRNRDGSFQVSGSEDIALLGTYTSQGSITDDKFDSTYQSKADNGVFVLERPQPESR